MVSKSSIEAKIRKLLNQANDREGTPEGKAFLDRAMELMAQYGVSQNDVKQDVPYTNMGVTTIDLSETKYAKQQFYLIGCISKSLNCYTIGHKQYNKTPDKVAVYGREIDRERVVMLFSLASPAMLSSAVKSVSSGSDQVRLRRLSHMMGYAEAIYSSLNKNESETRSNIGDTKEIMLADYLNAKRFAEASFQGRLRSSPQSRVSSSDYADGYKSGSQFDAGDRSRLSDKRAIDA